MICNSITTLTLAISLNVSFFVPATVPEFSRKMEAEEEESLDSSVSDFTSGMAKTSPTAMTRPAEPTMMKGRRNPLRLYKNAPSAGPVNESKQGHDS